jgi:AbrB family looped-hinge helix DNA binding protein
MRVKSSARSNTVSFTTKGQVVIPRWLRKEFRIEDGTKAVITATEEGILLKPITVTAIRRARGILAARLGGKPLAQEMTEYRKEEQELEEARLARHGSR